MSIFVIKIVKIASHGLSWVLLLGLLSACSLLKSSSTREIVLEHDAYIYENSKDKKKVKAGEKFKWSSNDAVLIEAPGRGAVLLFNPKSSGAPVAITLPKKGASLDRESGVGEPPPGANDQKKDETKESSTQKSNEDKTEAKTSVDGQQIKPTNFEIDYLSVASIIERIYEVNALIEKNQLDSAIAMIDDIRHDFPTMKYLSFLKASCLYLKGELSGAKKLLQEALSDFPDNKSGKQMLSLINEKLGVKE